MPSLQQQPITVSIGAAGAIYPEGKHTIEASDGMTVSVWIQQQQIVVQVRKGFKNFENSLAIFFVYSFPSFFRYLCLCYFSRLFHLCLFIFLYVKLQRQT